MTTRKSCLWIAAAAAFAFSACLAGAPIDDRIAAEPGTLTVIGFSGNPGTTYSAYAFWANVDLLSPDAVTEAILGGRHVASGSIEGWGNAFDMTGAGDRMWAESGAFRVVLLDPAGSPTMFRLGSVGFTYGGAMVGIGAFPTALEPPPSEPATFTVNGFTGRGGLEVLMFPGDVDLSTPGAVALAIYSAVYVASGSIAPAEGSRAVFELIDLRPQPGYPEYPEYPEYLEQGTPDLRWKSSGTYQVIMRDPAGDTKHDDPANPIYRRATATFALGGSTVWIGAFAPVLAPPLEPEPDDPGTLIIDGFAGSFGDTVFVFPENANLSTLEAIADAIASEMIATGIDPLGGNVFDMLAQGNLIQWTESGAFQVVLMVIQTQEFHWATVTFTSGGATANFADFVRVQ